MQLLSILLDLLVYGLTGAVAAWYFYHRRRRELLGGFWGGAAIGTLGAILIHMVTNQEGWLIEFLNWLMKPKKWGDVTLIKVNLISAIAGAFLFVYILNRINHDRERRY